MPAAEAAAASSGESTNSIVSWRLPFIARKSATVGRLCLVNAIACPPFFARLSCRYRAMAGRTARRDLEKCHLTFQITLQYRVV